MSQVKKPTSTPSTPSGSYMKLTQTIITDFVNRHLSREERLVVMLYYAEQLSMEEIGAILDLPAARAHEIRQDVAARMRMQLDPASAQPVLVA